MIILFKILGLRRNSSPFIFNIKRFVVILWTISSFSLHADFKHEVVKGDTLYSISLKYKVAIKDLKRINNLKSNSIRVGRVLIIPSSTRDEIIAKKINDKPKSNNTNIKIHVVKVGDTIEAISKKYGIKEKALLAWNNLSSKILKVGFKLHLDEPDFLKPYIVKKGDSLSKLSMDFDISIKDILRFNYLENNPKLVIGQKLYIKRAYDNINFHYVKPGETLGKIAYIYGVTAKHLVHLNGEKATNLRVDSVLDVSKIVEKTLPNLKKSLQSKTKKRDGETFISHKVSIGETLYSIARRYGVLLEDLKTWNNLIGNSIFYNQELKIYDKSKSAIIADKALREVLVDKSDNSKIKVKAIANIASTKSKKLDLNFSTVLDINNAFDINALVILDPKIPIFEVNGVFYYWYKPKKVSQPSELYSEDWYSPLNAYKKASQLFKSFEKLVQSRPVKNNKLENKLIIIDPGHGGLDPGAIVKAKDGLNNEIFVVEDEYVYDIALRLYVYLKEYGANVELTILSPDHLIRDSVSANNTFVNIKNEVYNNYDLNKTDTVDSWINGTLEGLKKRLTVVNKFVNKYKNIKSEDILYISLHSDNSVGAPRCMGFYYQSEEGKGFDSHSKNIIEKMTSDFKRVPYIKGQNLYMLKNNVVKTKFLVELRNLAFDEEAWAIRSSKIRDRDSRILATAILKIL